MQSEVKFGDVPTISLTRTFLPRCVKDRWSTTDGGAGTTMCKAGWRDAFDLEGRSRALVAEHLRDWCVCWHSQLKLWVIIFLAAAHKPFLWSLYA